ncbi:hypothetical protein ACJIZ3_001272 [Penstemon smallii]|uniref:Uncharacterized protein n=1 Tax=Penstemon smallii TaxID=265156 RepID=A0ABD3U344_9LAMI
MACRTGIKNTKAMLLMKPFTEQRSMQVNKRLMRNLVELSPRIRSTKLEEMEEDGRRLDDLPGSCWVPHPRSGIYFPKGQDWVMEDIPNGAASFDRTFWLRNVDGVDDDKPYLRAN